MRSSTKRPCGRTPRWEEEGVFAAQTFERGNMQSDRLQLQSALRSLGDAKRRATSEFDPASLQQHQPGRKGWGGQGVTSPPWASL